MFRIAYEKRLIQRAVGIDACVTLTGASYREKLQAVACAPSSSAGQLKNAEMNDVAVTRASGRRSTRSRKNSNLYLSQTHQGISRNSLTVIILGHFPVWCAKPDR